jgi:tetratricopeptide (TPR) repeat protein
MHFLQKKNNTFSAAQYIKPVFPARTLFLTLAATIFSILSIILTGGTARADQFGTSSPQTVPLANHTAKTLIAQAPPAIPLPSGSPGGAKPDLTTLRAAVKNGAVSFKIKGDGVTTDQIKLELTNKTDKPLHLVIPANEVFRPNTANVQTMMVIRDRMVSLPAGSQLTVSLFTICASYKSLKPPPVDGVSFEIGNYPDMDTWKQLSNILAAARELNKKGAFDSLPFDDPKRRLHTMEQYSAWLMLGKKSIDPQDQLTKEAVGADFMKILEERAKTDPQFRSNLEKEHKLSPTGGIVLGAGEKQDVDRRIALILDGADLTLKRSADNDIQALAYGLPEDSTWGTLDQVGVRAFEQGDYTEAQELLEGAVKEAEKFGPEDLRLASSLNNLGRCLMEQGLSEKAEPVFKRALAIREQKTGPDSVEVAEIFNSLGTVYELRKKPADAEQSFQKALTIRQRKLGPEHIEVAITLNDLGGLYLSQGKLDQAETPLKNALAIRYKKMGKDSPDVAAVNVNLASLYVKQGKLPEAEKLYLVALAIDRKALNPDNPYLATILDGLVEVYKSSHKDKDAETFANTAQAIRQKALGGNATLIASLPQDYQTLSRVQNFTNSTETMEASAKDIQGTADPKLLASVVAEKTAAANRPVKDKWALVIGISKFQDATINLKYSAKDATDFYNYLIKEAHFQPDHIRLLLDEKATRTNIMSALGDTWLPRVAGPDDLVVFYFSGHGSPSSADQGGTNYLVAYDTDKNQLFATGLKMQDFTDLIKQRVHTDRVVICMDACHSGATEVGSKGIFRAKNFSVDDVVQGTGKYVVCSSQPSQVSWESTEYPNGVFTHYLIEGLRKNPKLGDACNYMKDKVQHEVLRDRGEMQTPVVGSHWEGEQAMIAAPPTQPGPGLPNDPLTIKAPAPSQAAKGTKSTGTATTKTKPSTATKGVVHPH